jgi:iron complex outermembrane receptor protein
MRHIYAGGLLGLGLIAPLAQAQDAPIQRVEVTGSSIKRLVSETANPLTVIKADDFRQARPDHRPGSAGPDSSNSSSFTSGNVVGGNTRPADRASADLRGLGGDKTLVLLNGRRIANHPYDGASVDLNIIPVAHWNAWKCCATAPRPSTAPTPSAA